MKFDVNYIKDIQPTYEGGIPCLQVNVYQNSSQQEHLLCTLWEEMGDEGFQRIFNSNGYVLKKKENTDE